MDRGSQWKWIAGAGLFVVSLLVYVVTLAPTIAGGDSGDLVMAASTLGIAHPPGYPLYLMLGRLFALVPVGDLAFRLNLSSAVFGALAVLLLYLLLIDLTGRLLPPVVGAASLAFSSLFWSYSLFAEVFALNNLFAALLLLLAVRWRKSPDNRLLLFGLSLTAGLALSHQQTIVLLAPAIGCIIWSPLRKTAPPRLALAAGCLVAGLLPYAYLPIAAGHDPWLAWESPATLSGFIRYVTRAEYGGTGLVSQTVGGAPRFAQVTLYAGSLAGQFTLVGVALGILGLWRLYRRARVLFAGFLGSFLLAGVLFALYTNVTPDAPGALSMLEKFYLLSFTVFALFIGLGAQQLQSLARKRIPRLVAPVGLTLLVLPAFLLVWNYGEVDSSRAYLGRQLGEDMLSSAGQGGIILAYSDDGLFIMNYLQRVENLRRDVVVISPGMLARSWYRQQLASEHSSIIVPAGDPGTDEGWALEFIKANWERQPVYFYGSAEELGSGLALAPRGVLLQVAPAEGLDLDAVRSDNDPIWTGYQARGQLRSYPAYSWRANVAQDYALAPYTLATAYHDAGRLEDAMALYQRSLGMSPDFPPSYANLGQIFLAQKDYTDALDNLKRFLSLRPYTEPASQVKMDVERLEGTR